MASLSLLGTAAAVSSAGFIIGQQGVNMVAAAVPVIGSASASVAAPVATAAVVGVAAAAGATALTGVPLILTSTAVALGAAGAGLALKTAYNEVAGIFSFGSSKDNMSWNPLTWFSTSSTTSTYDPKAWLLMSDLVSGLFGAIHQGYKHGFSGWRFVKDGAGFTAAVIAARQLTRLVTSDGNTLKQHQLEYLITFVTGAIVEMFSSIQAKPDNFVIANIVGEFFYEVIGRPDGPVTMPAMPF